MKVAENADGTYKATFIPDDCGRYKVTCKYGGKEVPTSGTPIQAYAIGKVSLSFVILCLDSEIFV